jgi:hypothetical protein
MLLRCCSLGVIAQLIVKYNKQASDFPSLNIATI